jgi:hypothetical protein
MTNCEVHLGRIYSIDQDFKLLVLFKGSEIVRDFIFLNINFIKNISIVDSESRGIDHDIQDIDLEKFVKEVEKKIQKEMKSNTINDKVSDKVQAIYNELCKTYLCEWDSAQITFPKFGVVICPPYRPENVEGPDQPRKRISIVLAKIREKLEIE